MKTNLYNLSTEYHLERCKDAAEGGNLQLLRAYLRYAMADLGLSQD